MYVAIYSTFSSLKDAKDFGRLLIEEKLVACVNIIRDVHSIYRWNGEIEEANEVILWCKTEDFLIEKIQSVFRETHPYSLPALVVYPIHSGSEEYLKWISNETQNL